MTAGREHSSNMIGIFFNTIRNVRCLSNRPLLNKYCSFTLSMVVHLNQSLASPIRSALTNAVRSVEIVEWIKTKELDRSNPGKHHIPLKVFEWNRTFEWVHPFAKELYRGIHPSFGSQLPCLSIRMIRWSTNVQIWLKKKKSSRIRSTLWSDDISLENLCASGEKKNARKIKS